MLQFILGRASSGKTYTVTQKIKECLDRGDKPVLLVPEQFSFESEKNILGTLGDAAAQHVSVLSFTRLCDDIERVHGGICGESITDADRIILMSRAIKNCLFDLVRFKKFASSNSFAKLMVDTIGEFKMNFISPDDLRRAAGEIDDEQLKIKILETALIYENYDAIIAEKFIDSTDRLTKLYYALQNYEYFDGKTVFIDSFKGFSGQQYMILERIMSQAKDVTVTLCDNPYDTRKFGLFYNAKILKNKITKIANKFSVKILDDIVLTRKNYNNDELSALEDFLATGHTDYAEECKNITVCECDTIYDEVDFAARNIRRIVRETGARYNDFVIIARNTETYEDALEIACQKNNIGCFIDKRIPLSHLPTATAVMSAVNAAKSFSTENILRFHKSGIDMLTVDELSTLENYIFVWNIDGDQWIREWTMDPRGFSANETLSAETQAELDAINLLREKAISPLVKFKNNFNDTAQDMARALVQLLKDVNAANAFKKHCKNYDNDTYNDAVKQSWDSVMRILNSMSVCLGTHAISKQEFSDALKIALSLETIGVVPQMQDEVTFGAADRIRPSRPKYAFILGANQGVFPQLHKNNGLFANNEREELISQGIEIPDKVYSLAIDEECLLYSNLCCAIDGVFISYAKQIGTDSGEASSFVADIKNKLKISFLKEPLGEKRLPETPDDALSLLCSMLSADQKSVDAATLKKALEESGSSDKIDSISKSINPKNQSISAETAHALFGDTLKMSSTKFDTFSKCRFSYFCKHGLNISSLQPAKFDNMQRGTIVHYVLQRIVEEHGKAISGFDTDKLREIINTYMQEYLDKVVGYRDIETPYLKYLVAGMELSLLYVVEHLAREFAQTEFEPVKCELNIAEYGDLPPIEITVDKDAKIQLTGQIDRLDKWQNYIRIVDYKTGERTLRLPDVLYGQNMQMLLYLYAVSESKKFGGESAGVLYMPAKRFKEKDKSKRKMNGLIAADKDVVLAMEKENKSQFIPKYEEDNPSRYFIPQDSFDDIFKYINNSVKQAGEKIYGGDIAAEPKDGLDKKACEYCEFKNICRIDENDIPKVPTMTNDEVIDEIKKKVKEYGI